MPSVTVKVDLFDGVLLELQLAVVVDQDRLVGLVAVPQILDRVLIRAVDLGEALLATGLAGRRRVSKKFTTPT
jgi:hypothetical protein